MTTRVFVYNDTEYDDPGQEYTVEDVKASLQAIFPEIAKCKIVETKENEGEENERTIYRFEKQATVKGQEIEESETSAQAIDASEAGESQPDRTLEAALSTALRALHIAFSPASVVVSTDKLADILGPLQYALEEYDVATATMSPYACVAVRKMVALVTDDMESLMSTQQVVFAGRVHDWVHLLLGVHEAIHLYIVDSQLAHALDDLECKFEIQVEGPDHARVDA